MPTIRALGRLAVTLGLISFIALGARTAQAQIGSDRYSAVVIDARTGNILTSMSPDAPRYPASLTKMMTLYLVFEAIRAGKLSLNTRIQMTETAAEMPPSKLGLPPGVGLTVEQAILAVITKSANDVATLLGETLGGGDEARFAQIMTMKARSLGMNNTTFRNASGLPNPDQMTTARDMATLGRHLILDFPERYGMFSTVRTKVVGVTLRSHNRMLDSYEGADGIKTGYINASGFNIVTSAVRARPDGEKVRLIAAVFGGSSWVERDKHAMALLDQGFIRSGVDIDGPGAMVASARVPSLIGRAEAATRVARPAITSRTARATAARAPARAAVARAAARRNAPAVRTVSRTAAARATVTRREVAAHKPAATPQRTATAQRASTTRTASSLYRRQMEQGDGGRMVTTLRAPVPHKPAVATPKPTRTAQN